MPPSETFPSSSVPNMVQGSCSGCRYYELGIVGSQVRRFSMLNLGLKGRASGFRQARLQTSLCEVHLPEVRPRCLLGHWLSDPSSMSRTDRFAGFLGGAAADAASDS